MSTRDEAMRLREQGMSHAEIANIIGVTRQRVAQITGKYSPGHFKRYSEKQVVYPNLRAWLNENRINRAELLRRLGIDYHTKSVARYNSYLSGKSYPPKLTIDKLITVTGLTYEQLFYREGD